MRHRTIAIASPLLAIALIGCDGPRRTEQYPPGALPVRYEAATTHSTCLVAGVAMAANYLLGQPKFTEKRIREELRQSGRDETLVADLKGYLEEKGLYLLTLSGQLNSKPPTDLAWWVEKRGYPAICVINRDPADPAFNHAVVVIGISRKPGGDSVDMIHYFDPSTRQRLYSSEAAAFEVLWARGQRAMMIVVAPPPDSQPARNN